jgi:two-component system, chemotaxis family, protein-glutamate methylesterase/glutaminase
MNKFNILIIDDEVYWRKHLSSDLSKIEDIGEITSAANGKIALSRLKSTNYDIVVLDMNLSKENSMLLLEKISEQFPSVATVVICDNYLKDSDIVIQALSLGSIAYLSKKDENGNELRNLNKKLLIPINIIKSRKHMRITVSETNDLVEQLDIEIKPKEDIASSLTIIEEKLPPIIKMKPRIIPVNIEAIAIGISTGGPNALMKLIPKLPNNIGVPIFLVQHMPAKLTASLANNLNSKSQLKIKEAEENEIIENDVVYIAPGGQHMCLEKVDVDGEKKVRIKINEDPPVNYVRPSVDVLFKSLPAVYTGHILSIIMTGMGSDGLDGVKTLKENRVYSLTQSEETCVVYGMPRAIDEAGLSDESIPLESIPQRIMEILTRIGL